MADVLILNDTEALVEELELDELSSAVDVDE
jgi:hypothetical protein